MDFNKLTTNELANYLSAYGLIDYSYLLAYYHNRENRTSLPALPYLDLYLASVYDGNINTDYTVRQIEEMGDEEIFDLAKQLHLDPNDGYVRSRATRILRILGKLKGRQKYELYGVGTTAGYKVGEY